MNYLGDLLLHLCSQVCLWGSPFWVRFLLMWSFKKKKNLTIEVVTFRLRGWCMLGVFAAGIHPSRTWMSGSFESARWNACVHRLNLGPFCHPKEFLGNGARTHVYSKGKIPSTRRLQRGSNLQCCITQNSQPHTLPTKLSRPHLGDNQRKLHTRCHSPEGYVPDWVHLVGLMGRRLPSEIVGWLLNVPATCWCISGTDLLRHCTWCHTGIEVAI